MYLCRKIEYEYGEVEDANAGDNQVHNVEQRLSSNLQVEENVCKKNNQVHKVEQRLSSDLQVEENVCKKEVEMPHEDTTRKNIIIIIHCF